MTSCAAQPQPPLRRHQRLALAALEDAWATGRRRSWVELPPGAGKTRVGLEAARSLLSTGTVGRVVVMGPNSAIQGQWLAQAEKAGLDAGADRELEDELTSLT